MRKHGYKAVIRRAIVDGTLYRLNTYVKMKTAAKKMGEVKRRETNRYLKAVFLRAW